jgi:anti-sigma factor RsiW
MSEIPAPVHDDELHAFVDAQIDPDRLPTVLAWLQAHPQDAARVLQWQAQRVQLRKLSQTIDLGHTPAALTDVVLRASRGARRRTQWLQAAAVLMMVTAGFTAGHFWGPAGGAGGARDAIALAASPPFVREAVAAHAVFVPELRHPVEVGASDEAHLVQWLSRRLGTPLKAPSLSKFGYHLLGGRLLPGDGIPRAQFMFENPQGARVTLYITVFAAGQAPDSTSFRSVRVGEEESFYWIDERFGYALNSKVNAADMQALAREVYAQLER